MKRNFTLALCLILAIISSVSCGAESGEETTTSQNDTTSAPEITEAVYEYPDLKLGGESFDILNSESVWSIYMDLDKAEMTGETLDDAIYQRNRFIEEKTGCVIKVENYPTGGDFSKLTNHAANLILSGDDTYEVMFIKPAAKVDMITDGALVDLRSLSSLRLDEDWWDHIVSDLAATKALPIRTAGIPSTVYRLIRSR